VKIAICDDEELCRTQVFALAKEYSEAHPEQHFAFSAFSCGEDLLDAAGKIGGYDVYILDIVMPYMNGIDLGVALRGRGYDGKIIYLTASEEYAIESFKVKPYNYLLKPFDRDAFCNALDDALASLLDQKNKAIIVKTQVSSIKLNLHQILCTQLHRRVIIYHLTDGRTVESIQIRTTFAEAVQELTADRRFVLCGAGMAVNLHHITEVENEALVFQNTLRVYPGKKACREVRSAWYDYNFDGEGSE